MNDKIRYRAGYKYVLAETYSVPTALRPERAGKTWLVDIHESGILVVRAGFAWDGPSGPALDTRSMMRASLIHDALYYLMRQGALDRRRWREAADKEFRRAYDEDVKVLASRDYPGFGLLRRTIGRLRKNWTFGAVRLGAYRSATPQGERQIIEAP